MTKSLTLSFRRGVEDATNQSDAILYRAEDIESHSDLGFNLADFIFITLVAGGDYSVRQTAHVWTFPNG